MNTTNRRVQSWQLAQRQALPLEAKVILSLRRIQAWHEAWDGHVYVAFSGGLDSTALLHLVRTRHPDVPGVFVNTGMEFPENVRFVKRTPDVHTTRPKMRFQEVIRRYGWPVVSKRVAQYVHEVQHSRGETATKHLRLTGIRSDGTYSKMGKIPDKWQYLIDAPFPISDRCCYIMKKGPALACEAQFGKPILGVRADEGHQRELAYMQHGCNAFHLKHPKSNPIAFWTHDDVWAYIQTYKIPYSPLYDMGYRRSGCVFCAFGAHMEKEPNRFQRLRETHPKLYKYCMERLGMAEVLDFIKVPYGPIAQPCLPGLARPTGPEKSHA